jgi:hypothetical protein
MYNVNNYMLAQAIQKDHLRDAKQNRLARLIENRRREKLAKYQKKERS